MTYQELINNIRDLGFSDDSEIAEFGELVYNAINRAISKINVEFAHIKQKYEFELTDEDTGYIYITMPEIDPNFIGFAENPVTFALPSGKDSDDNIIYKQTYQIFSDYQIEMDDTLVINADDCKGKFRIFYISAHEPFIGEAAQLSAQLPLPLRAHHIVPLLASYFVWLEDEPTKAAEYYNLYEQQQAEYQTQASRPKMRVLSGGL